MQPAELFRFGAIDSLDVMRNVAAYKSRRFFGKDDQFLLSDWGIYWQWAQIRLIVTSLLLYR
jgi:hypothetical protein